MSTTRGVQTTGNGDIDCATAEIAGHIRDGRVGSHVKWTEQDHYDEAMRLRDEIMKGTRAEIVAGLRALAADDPHWFTDRFATTALSDLIESGDLPAGLVPATVSPSVITDDIALNIAAGVLEAYGRPATADMLRRMLPAAEGKIHGETYQEPVGKWNGLAAQSG